MSIALYITIGFWLLISLLSSIYTPKWYIKGWDFGRAYWIIAMLVTFAFACYKFDATNWVDISLLIGLVIGMVYHAWHVIPLTKLVKKQLPDAKAQDNALSLLACNVRQKNKTYGKLLDQIDKYDPDIILLTETDQYWADKMQEAGLEDRYPSVLKCPINNAYGMCFYARFPIEDGMVRFAVQDDIPSVHTTLRINDRQTINFIGIHPPPPAPGYIEENKDIELMKVAYEVQQNNMPAIVTGDLNDVGWSKITRRFKAVSGLKDPRIGRGFYNTYNANFPVFRYPIDHVFVSDHFTLIDMKRLPHMGSDHFPVYIELQLHKVA